MAHTKTIPSFDEYAIIQTGGKQYQAIPGQTLQIEKIDGEAGATLTFDKVLLTKKADSVAIGQPYVAGTQVEASIIKQIKGPKKIVFKFKRRKKVRVKKGHRQPHTVVRITGIKAA